MSGIIDFFIPKDKKFFEYLNQQISLLNNCVNHLNSLTQKKKVNRKQFKKALLFTRQISEKTDKLTQEVTNALHQTFITPIDRDEIQSLSTNLNRIIDSVEKIIASIYYFKIEKIDTYFIKQIKILQETVSILKMMFKKPLNIKGNRSAIEKVKYLEKKGDDTYRQAIGNLFNNSHSTMEVIKQKEIYQIIEEAIDEAKVTTEVFETVLINNS